MLVFLSAAFVASAGFAATLVAASAFITAAFVAGVAVVAVVAAAGAG